MCAPKAAAAIKQGTNAGGVCLPRPKKRFKKPFELPQRHRHNVELHFDIVPSVPNANPKCFGRILVVTVRNKQAIHRLARTFCVVNRQVSHMAAHWLSLRGFLARIVGKRHLDRNDVVIELKNESWTVARGSSDRQKILVNLETPRIKRLDRKSTRLNSSH